MKAFKAFIKPFEAPQRSVKIKLNLIFSLRLGLGGEGLRTFNPQNINENKTKKSRVVRQDQKL